MKKQEREKTIIKTQDLMVEKAPYAKQLEERKDNFTSGTVRLVGYGSSTASSYVSSNGLSPLTGDIYWQIVGSDIIVRAYIEGTRRRHQDLVGS